MNDLAYFISLMEKETEPSPNIWDRRARSWAHERKNNRKTDERLEKDFLFLENHGLLKKDFSVADIGCGPGRFAAAFASRVRFVTALDISGEMIAQGTPAELMRSETMEHIYGIPMGILPHPAGAAPVSFVY